jgi:hypothetical protein
MGRRLPENRRGLRRGFWGDRRGTHIAVAPKSARRPRGPAAQPDEETAMWGLNWGQMVWGQSQAAAVPAVSFWGMIVLAAALGAWGVSRLRGPRPRVVGTIALALILFLPITARALPFTFTNGTVADATQVNANFAAIVAGQGLAPTASSNVVDLTQSGTCPQATSGTTLGNRVGSDGVGSAFSIATGQTLILTQLSVQFTLGAGAANHGISVQFWRFNPGGGGPFENTVVNLDGAGVGNATVSLGSGSAFGAGTKLCVLAQDISNSSTAVTSSFAGAHGFLTTQ